MRTLKAPMAILIFALSLALLVGGVACGYLSLDLLPTPVGVLYALAGAVAVTMAVVTFALGVMIRRIGALMELAHQSVESFSFQLGPGATQHVGPGATQHVEAAFFPDDPAPVQGEGVVEIDGVAEPAILAEEAPGSVDQDWAGNQPIPTEFEHAIETPEAAPSLVGRYASGGASYMIFADGSIEAETAEGAFKFRSLEEFKHWLAERGAEGVAAKPESPASGDPY
jgi:hypothetical protein